jgi:hypothetical protein
MVPLQSKDQICEANFLKFNLNEAPEQLPEITMVLQELIRLQQERK